MAKFADMFIAPESDPRIDPPAQTDERTTLAAFLKWQRDTLELKCVDLTPEQLAAKPLEFSSLSLLGLVRHMADVERGWFRAKLAGWDAPAHFYTEEDRDGAFDNVAADPQMIAQAWHTWKAEIAFADQFMADAPDLDVFGPDPWRGVVTLRWVLVHMIEEYARHNGHADMLRQRIDGRVGQ
jgi:uncharacterized damage-inducible protein DinB